MSDLQIAGILSEARERALVSILWLPYCYMLLATAVLFTLGLLGVPEEIVWPVGLLWIPLGWAALSVGIGLIVAKSTRDEPLHCILWAAALPARSWTWLWGTILTLLFTRFFWSLLVLALLTFVTVVIVLMIVGGAPWWLTLIVCVGLLGLTAGGARWGNQYGGGITGGVALGPIILAFLGIWGWVSALALAVIALIAAPWFVVWMVMNPWSDAWGLGLSTGGIVALVVVTLVTCVAPYVLDLRR